MGDALSADLKTLLAEPGRPLPVRCIVPEGTAAIETLVERLAPAAGLAYPVKASVLDGLAPGTMALPGGHLLVDISMIHAAGTPEDLAGLVAHQIGHLLHRDAMRNLLADADLMTTAHILTGDVLRPSVIEAAQSSLGGQSFSEQAEQRADQSALKLLAGTGLPTGQYGRLSTQFGGGGTAPSRI